MKINSVQSRLSRISARAMGVVIGGISVAFICGVLLPGVYLVHQLAASAAAMKFVGEIRPTPTVLRDGLESVRDRLSARGYLQTSLDQVRRSASELERGLESMSNPQSGGWFEPPQGSAAFSDSKLAAQVASMHTRWLQDRQSLDPVLKFDSVPYQDSASTGTELNDAGRTLARDVNTAVHSVHGMTPALESTFASISAELQAKNLAATTELRYVMVTGLALAALLVSLVLVSMTARARQEQMAREARQQTQDILRTVKDGLFLLDENLIIGGEYSAALCNLFHREDFAGISFEALLKDIVPERTLSTAMQYVKVLWSERTNENLVKSINPLGKVEVHFHDGGGSHATNYLEFDFHRVRTDGAIAHLLVSVTDVSLGVALAQELAASQDKSQSQLDTMLGILHIDPTQLASFLKDSDVAMKMINAVLKEPAREEAMFRKKLDTIFRQVHAVKGEAAALGLSSIAGRAHSFEDELRAMREKSSLSGNDFLPLAIKLDDLFTHLHSIRDLVDRLSKLHVSAQDDDAAEEGTATDVGVPQQTRGAAGIEATINQLAQRIASENGKEVVVECVGFGVLPLEYRRTVKDIAVQTVRNAVVHGIEPSAVRLANGKSAHGTFRIEARDLGDNGYKLMIEDDGQGLSVDRIKQVAIEKKFITTEQAENMDARKCLSLLFTPGFSTAGVETQDAGRGVGLDLVADLIRQAGGKIRVTSVPGMFTRFSVMLPAVQAAVLSAEVGEVA